jgi:hypothetical protein
MLYQFIFLMFIDVAQSLILERKDVLLRQLVLAELVTSY